MAESKLYFKNQDGIMLCGILAKTPAPITKCVFLCHGLTGTGKAGEIFEELASKLADAGLASFRFDFRGHGESEGNCNDITLTGEKRDIEAAFSFAKKRDTGISVFWRQVLSPVRFRFICGKIRPPRKCWYFGIRYWNMAGFLSRGFLGQG